MVDMTLCVCVYMVGHYVRLFFGFVVCLWVGGMVDGENDTVCVVYIYIYGQSLSYGIACIRTKVGHQPLPLPHPHRHALKVVISHLYK